YTIVGKVVSGMDLVDKIKKGDEADNGTVTDPDRMIKVRIAADGK
ncbi:MAG: peptidylprolyl isomerase, partial [Mesorhizobium sp.]